MAVLVEPEVGMGRRAFPKAQELLAGVPLRQLPSRVDVTWHGTETDEETGSFAVVSLDGDPDLIGEVLRVSSGGRSVYVYVLGARAIEAPLSLTRRAFLSIARLSRESVPALVEVIA